MFKLKSNHVHIVEWTRELCIIVIDCLIQVARLQCSFFIFFYAAASLLTVWYLNLEFDDSKRHVKSRSGTYPNLIG